MTTFIQKLTNLVSATEQLFYSPAGNLSIGQSARICDCIQKIRKQTEMIEKILKDN